VLGEQLQRLDEELGEREVGQAARDHHRRALDGYEAAQRDLDDLHDGDGVRSLTDRLADARYEIACVSALASGEPLPEKRVGCFFNPQHGPSERDVVKTFPRTGTRKVPACVQCAARVEAREEPEARQVRLGDRTVPYWDAGTAYLPYLQGNFMVPAAGSQGWTHQLPISAAPSGALGFDDGDGQF